MQTKKCDFHYTSTKTPASVISYIEKHMQRSYFCHFALVTLVFLSVLCLSYKCYLYFNLGPFKSLLLIENLIEFNCLLNFFCKHINLAHLIVLMLSIILSSFRKAYGFFLHIQC